MRDKVLTRLRQIRDVFHATRKADRKLVPLLIGTTLLVAAAVAAVGWFILTPWVAVVVGLLTGMFAATFVFGRRATNAQFAVMRGQPGAAAAVLQQLRGRWIVTPAVAFTRQQDLVHRVVGPPGVVLVGEGRKARTMQLLRQEQRKVGRAVGDTPVHIVAVGDGEDRVPIDKLRTHVIKLKRRLPRKEIPAVNKRLDALTGGELPIPKGPMPSGAKMPRPKRR